jgi:hypothetical protein
MRWFVEISSLGKDAAAPKVLCVDAAQWQPALQKARSLSGDDGPLSNFSIELLDDGYRAIDPATRHKFIVRRAPDDEPLSEAPPAAPAPAAKASTPAPAPAAKASTPAPAKAAAAGSAGLATTMVFGSQGSVETRTPAEAAREDAKRASSRPITLVDESTTVAPALAEKVAAAVFSAEPTVVGAPIEVLFKREDDPSERSPLTYREVGYLVDEGTPEDACVALLRERFEEVRVALRAVKNGRLVNLAVFDHRFTGKPRRRPVATLTWKDWRGDEPEIRFPAREAPGETPTPLAPMPIVEVEGKAEPAPKPQPVVEAKPEPKPAPKAPAAPEAKAEPERRSTPPADRGRKSTPPAEKRRSNPPPASQRVSGDDLLAELFEAFCDLHFLRDSLEGADFIVSLIAEKLPCEVCLVSLFDIDRREFVVVRQNGGRTNVLLQRQPDRAPIALTAMRSRRAVVVRDGAADPRVVDARWQALGVDIKSYACAPVELAGRYLGLIELANPLDGGRFTESDGNALTYIGQQFGEFVGQHGVIVDAESVAPPPPPPAATSTRAPQRVSSPPSRASSPPKSQKPASTQSGRRR